MAQPDDNAGISGVAHTVTPETIAHLDHERECALARLRVCSSANVSEAEQVVRAVRATRGSDPAMRAVKPAGEPPSDITARFATLNKIAG